MAKTVWCDSIVQFPAFPSSGEYVFSYDTVCEISASQIWRERFEVTAARLSKLSAFCFIKIQVKDFLPIYIGSSIFRCSFPVPVAGLQISQLLRLAFSFEHNFLDQFLKNDATLFDKSSLICWNARWAPLYRRKSTSSSESKQSNIKTNVRV